MIRWFYLDTPSPRRAKKERETVLALGNAAVRKRKLIHSGDPVALAPTPPCAGLRLGRWRTGVFRAFCYQAEVLVLISRALQRLRGPRRCPESALWGSFRCKILFGYSVPGACLFYFPGCFVCAAHTFLTGRGVCVCVWRNNTADTGLMSADSPVFLNGVCQWWEESNRRWYSCAVCVA